MHKIGYFFKKLFHVYLLIWVYDPHKSHDPTLRGDEALVIFF